MSVIGKTGSIFGKSKVNGMTTDTPQTEEKIGLLKILIMFSVSSAVFDALLSFLNFLLENFLLEDNP